MPRKKTRKSRAVDHQLLIFEIKAWEPSYSFSVNRNFDREGDYSEYAELHLDTVCVYPEQYAGRPANITASSRRELFDRRNRMLKPEDRPTDLGLLELRPSGGSFYGGIPHDSLSFIVSALMAGQFRYVMLSGPSLKHGHSLPTELNFARTAE